MEPRIRSHRAGTFGPDMPTPEHIVACKPDMYLRSPFSDLVDWDAVGYLSSLPFSPWPSVLLPLPWFTPVYEGEQPRSLGIGTKRDTCLQNGHAKTAVP